MLNQAVSGDVTLGHYIGKSEAQLRVGWQTVADFVEAAAAKVAAAQAQAYANQQDGAQIDAPLVNAPPSLSVAAAGLQRDAAMCRPREKRARQPGRTLVPT